jgi:hypothetical protein
MTISRKRKEIILTLQVSKEILAVKLRGIRRFLKDVTGAKNQWR